MAAKDEIPSVTTHTEYVRGRVRCLSCGDTVPLEAATGRRCSRCVGVAP